MSKVKILVVEDEVIIADNICDALEDLGYKALEPAISYTEALETIEKEQPDIAILDVQLSGKKTGIDIAKVIREKYDFPFIFLTSNSDANTVEEAKQVMPPAYLIKPFTKEELFSSIEIALHNYSRKIGEVKGKNLIIKDAIFIKEKGVYNKVLFRDILYLKSAHVYVEIVLKNKQKHVIRESLNEVLTNLSNQFIRVHRSFIINTSYLNSISQISLTISDETIPLGKKYKEEILKSINIT